ncbi:MAG: hypothetical protein HFI91_01080 [Lachnospiraceae bacterium]|jgi:hypothetical protein|nr:hypothetical protein [Lachnospiraceae bacterium]
MDKHEIDELLQQDHVCFDVGDNAMEIEFSPEGAAFIGWIDTYNDSIFYYDNGSGNREVVDLMINCCPEERMMCYDQEILKEIVYYFCETGERNPRYNWIEDMFEVS